MSEFKKKITKKVFDVAEKAFPGEIKAVKDFFKKTYDSSRVHMSEDSAFEYSKKATREFKQKGLSGGVSEGPPPKKGPNPQGLSKGGCPYRQPSKKNIYPGNNGIQLKGQKFRGVR